MRALIISLIILICILVFSVFNTIYINVKLSELTNLTERISEESLQSVLNDITDIWEPLSDFLRITVTDAKINPVEKAIARLEQIAQGSKSDLLIARSDLLYALGEISELERITLLQIF